MSTFDPNNLDIDFDNLDKNPEHDSVRETQAPNDTKKTADSQVSKKTQSKPVSKKPDPLDEVKTETKQYTVEKDITKEPKEKKSDSMLSEIMDSEDSSDKKSSESSEDSTQKDDKVVYDINLTTVDDIMQLLLENEYEFATLEPEEDVVKVIFRQDKTPVNTKLIKYVTYTKLLLKIKALTKLQVEDTESTQTGSGEYKYKNKWFKITSKTSPSPQGEKVFFKASEVAKKVAAAKNQKDSFKTMLKFMGIVAFLFLILGGTFITFVVMNAQTVDDVNFFRSLGINPNDINAFIQYIVTIIFAILVFLETIFVVIYGFKFFLTKKAQKAKKVVSGILAAIFLIVAFSTASLWLYIDTQVKLLPNWGDVARGDIQIYDTDILASDKYGKDVAQLSAASLTNLIGPVDLRFDVSVLADSEARKGFQIQKYIWDFGQNSSNKDTIIETVSPFILYTFDEQRTYEITLTLEGVDVVGQEFTKTQDIPTVEITQLIEIQEELLDSGGKILKFNAESLKQRGTLEWYYNDLQADPVSKGYIFLPGTPIFEETVIGLRVKNSIEKVDESFDRIFIIKPESDDSISGSILAAPNIDNPLLYTLSVINIENDFGAGTIEEFTWLLDGKEVIREGNIGNQQKASEIEYEFKKYGENEVQVVLTDSLGKKNTLSYTVNIDKKLLLEDPLEILEDAILFDDVEYKQKLGEYWIDELPVPTSLTFSARKVKPSDNQYSLKTVKWDFDNDGNIDETGNYVSYDFPVARDYEITVNYTFVHRTRQTEVESIEKIYIRALKKDAILKLGIEKDTQYVPVTVRFDASQSSVLGQDIVKFEYDYGDGIIEERDAINEGHIYREAGEYNVKLTVTTNTGDKYSTTKKLVLTTRPDLVKITPSLFDAPAFQEIDFSSDDSSGQIVSYFWTFGDGNSSTQANPSHSYSRAGEYTVTLQIEFQNNNVKTDEIKVNILP